MKLKLTMYNGISKDPNNYLLLQYSNNLCTEYLCGVSTIYNLGVPALDLTTP